MVSVYPGAADGAVSSIRPLSSSASITRAGVDVTATFGLAIDARDSRGNVITDPAVALNTAVTATVTSAGRGRVITRARRRDL